MPGATIEPIPVAIVCSSCVTLIFLFLGLINLFLFFIQVSGRFRLQNQTESVTPPPLLRCTNCARHIDEKNEQFLYLVSTSVSITFKLELLCHVVFAHGGYTNSIHLRTNPKHHLDGYRKV